ncbi:MAG: thioredoxin domain-containing protein [Elusimicrobia bacterium]|nr:thioredoxin domain-containing protein [Elusimicrobiota bacterium]
MEKIRTAKFFSAAILIILTTFAIFRLRQSDSSSHPPSPSFRIAGAKKPKITIFEYSDFACPACAAANEKLKTVLSAYGDKIQINFKHYPLIGIHRFSLDAAVYADCAGKQGKFWEFADILFENREKWANNENFKKEFESYAKKISLNFPEMEKCHADLAVLKEVKSDISYGELKGIDATPTFFINGKRAVGGGQLINELRRLAAKEL